MTSLLGPLLPPDVHVMSFNVRRRLPPWITPRAERWSARGPRVAELLREEQPTILGAQEVMPDQATVLAAALGPDYRRIGYGRQADGRGEGCPIFYDADRLDLLGWSQRALSSTPAEAGSKSWGNLVPRVVVAARFADRATSRRLLFVNTHLDPLSPRSRRCSAHAVRRLVAQEDIPAVVTADFNATASAPALRELRRDGVLRDAWAIAAERYTPEWNTFVGRAAPRRTHGRIDGILVSSAVEVRRVAVNVAAYGGGRPSDHAPVQAFLRISRDDEGT
ncbi:endonuclease/exonuclease/phosphatase family protein [Microbacterium koreense]|uniref:Endonuclease/exonuclease/phosphatase family protein n=1 Tax=Microbacterium koreense TaxID=323761 RepID=A0ABW2ZMP7_9MICO